MKYNIKFLALALLLLFVPMQARADWNPTVITQSALNGVSITDANATHNKCRGVWVGTTQSIDLSFDGSTWVLFQGATAGTTLPFQVSGARKTAGSAAPTAGDIVFLY